MHFACLTHATHAQVEVDHWRSFGFRLGHKARPSVYLAANSQKDFYNWTERIKV